MRHVVIVAECDACLADGGDGVSETVPRSIALDGGAARELDLCPTHDKALIGALVDLLDAAGSPPQEVLQGPRRGQGRPRAADSPSGPCRICGKDLTRSGMAAHVWTFHIGRPRPPQPTTCPDCGYTGKPTGVGVHRQRAHGYDSVAEALALVR